MNSKDKKKSDGKKKQSNQIIRTVWFAVIVILSAYFIQTTIALAVNLLKL